MWKILLWLLGSCRVRITGGSPAWAVSRLSEARILLRDVTPIDDFTIEARILTRDAARADAACTRAKRVYYGYWTSTFLRMTFAVRN